jgi:hypothetical protein
MKVLRIQCVDNARFEYDIQDGDPGLNSALAALDKAIQGQPIKSVDISLPGFSAVFRPSSIIAYALLDYDSPESMADSIATRVAREKADKMMDEGVSAANGKVWIG